MVSLGTLVIKPIIKGRKSGSLRLKVLNTFPETLTFLLPPSLPLSLFAILVISSGIISNICRGIGGEWC